MKSSKLGFSWLVLLVGLFAAGIVITYVLVGAIRDSRLQGTYVSCFASQRVLLGSLEMYFMDHKEKTFSVHEANELLTTRIQELAGPGRNATPQDQVQGWFYEIGLPKTALPVCHITAVASGPDVALTCSIHLSQDHPRPLDDLKKLINY